MKILNFIDSRPRTHIATDESHGREIVPHMPPAFLTRGAIGTELVDRLGQFPSVRESL
jgi:hypothetical protein